MTPLQVDDRYAFWHHQLAMLGERDPRVVLGETPVVLMNLLQAFPRGESWDRGEEGRWTPRQVVTHLLDVECSFAFRIRTVLFDERPSLMPMDQDRWVAGQDHHAVGVAERVGELCQVREVNLRLWRRVSAADLERTGYHVDAGVELTLRTMLSLHAGHDLWHLRRIQEMLA